MLEATGWRTPLKEIVLENKCKLVKGLFASDLYGTEVRWWIIKPDGKTYGSCSGYKKAYQIAMELF